jgi:hypothetical protein
MLVVIVIRILVAVFNKGNGCELSIARVTNMKPELNGWILEPRLDGAQLHPGSLLDPMFR